MSEKEQRANYNRLNIERWHREIEEANETLLGIKPVASELLKQVMSFSDNVTEQYVLQFARKQIELYELIADAKDYHEKVSKDSGNQDYINAVLNYGDFLLDIADGLAVFGVEEIVSEKGTAFDVRNHEAVTQKEFSPKNSTVLKSLRSGFRYKDIVLMKEKVQI